MTLTPALAAIFFDSILSPMAAIAAAGGPMKATPALFRALANAAFSERNP